MKLTEESIKHSTEMGKSLAKIITPAFIQIHDLHDMSDDAQDEGYAVDTEHIDERLQFVVGSVAYVIRQADPSWDVGKFLYHVYKDTKYKHSLEWWRKRNLDINSGTMPIVPNGSKKLQIRKGLKQEEQAYSANDIPKVTPSKKTKSEDSFFGKAFPKSKPNMSEQEYFDSTMGSNWPKINLDKESN